ncbi:hypothetical protein ACFYPH_19465 [Micromonospora sp. NPDC005252]|uniref:hypothetical protein n=1 Tax=Micromonospora sp. NPDC005252 TaxID=3364228 RepID=UPI00367554AC
MQGDSSRLVRSGLRFVAVLSVAHIAMAGFVTASLYQVGTLFAGRLDAQLTVGLCLVAALVAAAFDVHAIRTDSYAPGLRRQTSKELGHRENIPWWVPPMIWGLDTGLMWSTFRVSATTWVLLVAALLNVAPQWSGLVFGGAFTGPLVVAILAGHGSVSDLGRPGPRRLVQSTAVATALLPAMVVVVSSVI